VNTGPGEILDMLRIGKIAQQDLIMFGSKAAILQACGISANFNQFSFSQ
jgi:hypothetical protein